MMSNPGAAPVAQQINLYLPEIRPRKDLVTAVRTLAVLALVVVLMVLVTAVGYWQRASLRSQLTDVQAQVAAQTSRTEELERQVAARATDQALVREMTAREQRLAQSEELYEFMRTTNLGNLTGFSAHLMDMSRASFPGLWLTSFSIRGNAEHVSLRGYAQEAAMLPDFVSRLSMGESEIRSKNFGRMSTTRLTAEDGSDESYQFVLETN